MRVAVVFAFVVVLAINIPTTESVNKSSSSSPSSSTTFRDALKKLLHLLEQRRQQSDIDGATADTREEAEVEVRESVRGVAAEEREVLLTSDSLDEAATKEEKILESYVDMDGGKTIHDKFASPVEPADEDDDLILTEEQKTQLTGTQVKRKVGTVKLWPKGKVYFRFGPKARDWDVNTRNLIKRGFLQWQSTTCIRFVEVNAQMINRYRLPTWVEVGSGQGCSSGVGRSTRPVRLTLGSGCLHEGIAAHEVGHALGFLHEQNRKDRDYFVRINWRNLKVGRDNINFAIPSYTKNLAPYDAASDLEYGPKAFARNQQINTIETVDRTLQFLLGSRDVLSFYDIQSASRLYKCAAHCRTPPRCYNTGFVNFKCKCYCPDLLAGAQCNYLNPTGRSVYDVPCQDIKNARTCALYKQRGLCQGKEGLIYCPSTCLRCSLTSANSRVNRACAVMKYLRKGQTFRIQSPQYRRTKCVWFFKTDPRSRLTLQMQSFQVTSDARTGFCFSWLEVRYVYPSQQGPRFCGRSWNKGSVRSAYEYMIVRYDSTYLSKRPGAGITAVISAV